jgi:ABC-type sugar transport system permease subunit
MAQTRRLGESSTWAKIKRNWGLYLMMLPAIIIFICFTYMPMYGVVIAFKNFKPAQGILSVLSLQSLLRIFRQEDEPARIGKGMQAEQVNGLQVSQADCVTQLAFDGEMGGAESDLCMQRIAIA